MKDTDIIETLRRLQCSDAACGDLRIAMGAKLAIYEIERLREQLRLANIDATNNEAEANELRAERDEVRREVARLLDVETGHRIAIADLTSERDEARREVCTWQGLESGRGKQHVAVARGWNYLTFPDQAALDALAKLDEEMGL